MKKKGKQLRITQGDIIRGVRKPLPPAVRVYKDKTKYNRKKKENYE